MFLWSNLNIIQTKFWCFYCQHCTYFIPFSCVSIIEFEQVNVRGVNDSNTELFMMSFHFSFLENGLFYV